MQQKTNDMNNLRQRAKVVPNALGINQGELAMEELLDTIRRFKRRRATGPDEILMELFKEFNLGNVLEVLNERWREESIPEDALRAKYF